MIWRSIIVGLACSILSAVAGAVEKPYRVSFVGDAYDGKAWTTGIRIEMDEGWKTYWRMPGEAGIPPDFTWKSSVPANIEVLYPVPGRLADASGEAVGYQHEVIFPAIVNAGAANEVTLDLSMFFAVCRDICIPAQAEASVILGGAVSDPQGAVRVEEALERVPRPGNIVTAATVAVEDGKPVLQLKLDDVVDDIFVETTLAAYFRAPEFTAGNREARLVIDNVADLAALKGATLKLTLSRGGLGLEQSVTLP
jgi:DsbC/DsbD-like thiol-disulfide interchange protein